MQLKPKIRYVSKWILNVAHSVLEQCCIENGVPQRCIGLCIEEQHDSQDRFLSICDRYETVIEQCTGEKIVLQEGISII